MCLSYLARTLWLLGYAEQALQRSQEGLALAGTLANAMTLAQAQGMHTLLYQVQRDVESTQEWAEKTIAHATEHGFPYWLTLASMYKGWALVQQGQVEVGTAQFQRAVDAYLATGAKLGLSWMLALQAEFAAQSGHLDDALLVIDRALKHIDQTEEVYCAAELQRLRCELVLQDGGREAVSTAETYFCQSLEIARRQHAKAWELRTATSLARLWRTQGKGEDARELLASVYGWFTEGFETPDLQEARHLLEELGAAS